MSMFSLRTLIDDILLIVRNNNISESEDLSRAQIAAWVLHYKAALLKAKRDKDDADNANNEGRYDTEYTKTVGPLHMKFVDSLDETLLRTRTTEDTIDDLYDKDPKNIISVFDQEGCVIQPMHNLRRHYHYFRRYTGHELTYFYQNGYILVLGNQDCGWLKNIWVKYVAETDPDDLDLDEDDIEIPDYLVPDIKDKIFKNELAFMVRMPSDDDNNSTLDGIKPHGPQDLEK